jgi:hypothetical protein
MLTAHAQVLGKSAQRWSDRDWLDFMGSLKAEGATA